MLECELDSTVPSELQEKLEHSEKEGDFINQRVKTSGRKISSERVLLQPLVVLLHLLIPPVISAAKIAKNLRIRVASTTCNIVVSIGLVMIIIFLVHDAVTGH